MTRHASDSSRRTGSLSDIHAWKDKAECIQVDPVVFYGSSETLPMSRAEVAQARSVCYLCPVRRQCLAEALDTSEGWGVWGGLTPAERFRALSVFSSIEAVLAHYEAGDLEKLVVRL